MRVAVVRVPLMARVRKTLAIPDDLHAAWTAAAAKEGLSLIAYVTRAVEVAQNPLFASLKQIEVRPIRPITSTIVNPATCTNRLRAGTWCRMCGAIHKKDS